MSLQHALAKTRGGFLSRLLSRPKDEPITPEFLDELEEGLLRADLSVSLVDPLMAQVRDLVATGTLKTVPKALDAVRDVLVAELSARGGALNTSPRAPRVVLVVGVNGSGKTTTAAKLAKRLKEDGESPLLAAADTFRAAAIQQLETWAKRVDVPVVSGRPDGDPAAVVFDAVNAASARGNSTVIADTAGRLHTKGHLMDELGKIVRVAGRAREGAPDEVLLVLDGTAGQNAIQQARQFTKDAKVTGLVITKLDGTAKGGAVFAIVHELGLPVKFLGVGEKAEDLVPLVDQGGLHEEFDQWVLGAVCNQLLRWAVEGVDVPLVAVNLWAHTLRMPNIVDTVRATFSVREVDTRRVEIECPKGSVRDPSLAGPVQRLRTLGLRLASEEFGDPAIADAASGFDTLKVGYPLARDLNAVGSGSAEAVMAIVAAAGAAGARVVADSVETKEQEDVLVGLGCEIVQGRLYGPEVAADELRTLLSKSGEVH